MREGWQEPWLSILLAAAISSVRLCVPPSRAVLLHILGF